jgi:hypothetical protein
MFELLCVDENKYRTYFYTNELNDDTFVILDSIGLSVISSKELENELFVMRETVTYSYPDIMN